MTTPTLREKIGKWYDEFWDTHEQKYPDGDTIATFVLQEISAEIDGMMRYNRFRQETEEKMTDKDRWQESAWNTTLSELKKKLGSIEK